MINNIINKYLSNKYLQLIFRLLLGAMFVTVAMTKIPNPEKFANEIGNYNLLPEISLNLMALFLPWLELITGMLLIFGYKVKENSFLILGMLVVFTLGVLSAMARGLDINCGCYSEIAVKKVGWEKVLENTGLIIIAFFLFITNKVEPNPKNEIVIENP